jgi:hypothetical protein
MNRRVFSAMVGVAIALPSAVLQLALVVHAHPAAMNFLPWLAAGNLVLLAALVATAADYPLAGREGRAALVGFAVALVMPAPTALDSILTFSAPPAILLPYVLLLGMLACAESGLYLLATRPGAAERS